MEFFSSTRLAILKSLEKLHFVLVNNRLSESFDKSGVIMYQIQWQIPQTSQVLC